MNVIDKNHKRKLIVKVTSLYGKIVIYEDEPNDKDKDKGAK